MCDSLADSSGTPAVQQTITAGQGDQRHFGRPARRQQYLGPAHTIDCSMSGVLGSGIWSDAHPVRPEDRQRDRRPEHWPGVWPVCVDHDRSPLVRPDDLLADWLDPKVTDRETVREMIKSVPSPVLTPYPVSKAVNNVRNNRPDLVTPIGPA